MGKKKKASKGHLQNHKKTSITLKGKLRIQNKYFESSCLLFMFFSTTFPTGRATLHVNQPRAQSGEVHLNYAVTKDTAASMSVAWLAMLSLAILLQTSIRPFKKDLRVKLPAMELPTARSVISSGKHSVFCFKVLCFSILKLSPTCSSERCSVPPAWLPDHLNTKHAWAQLECRHGQNTCSYYLGPLLAGETD